MSCDIGTLVTQLLFFKFYHFISIAIMIGNIALHVLDSFCEGSQLVFNLYI